MCCAIAADDGSIVTAIEPDYLAAKVSAEATNDEPLAAAAQPAPEAPKEEPKEEPKVEPKVEPVVEAPAPVAAVKEEPPKVEIPAANGVEVDFVTGTGSQKVSFVRRPIGLTFGDGKPVAVKAVTVGGHAEQLGVQAGWTFKTIAGTDCSLMDQTMVIGSFRDATKGLEGSVEVEFKTADGQAVSKNFTQTPLDMKFGNAKPFVVTSVAPGGHADKLGVQQDWVITKVGGKLVANMEGADFTAHFRAQVAGLPKAGL